MTLDKIISEIGANPTVQDKIEKTSSKADKTSSKTKSETTSQSDNADLSSQARKLQETERILRFALERLEQFDEVRQEKLDVASERLDSDYYSSEEVDAAISDKIFSQDELQEKVRNHQQMSQFLADVQSMDEQQLTGEVDEAKLEEIRSRVKSGYYDREDVMGVVADRLMELTE